MHGPTTEACFLVLFSVLITGAYTRILLSSPGLFGWLVGWFVGGGAFDCSSTDWIRFMNGLFIVQNDLQAIK